ncbi:MAG: radical SAM protein [Clostridia bacterium]|nr:radical SAM protein [Clostridia bacterium]
MNRYLKNLEKIEFVVTYACTGKCRHCSEGDHKSCGTHIDPAVAADAVRKIASAYNIKTVMTFGGEPLLYPEAVYAVMETAKKLDIPKRQVITNGYFSKDEARIGNVAVRLAEAGVNDLLLSSDAFHQEYIPIEPVKFFAVEAKNAGVPIRIQPAWLVSKDDENPYNQKTREILAEFSALGISENDGNVIFPEGNALKYLSEYFRGTLPENPYVEDPADVRCVSFDPDGSVMGSNVYEKDILSILDEYKP